MRILLCNFHYPPGSGNSRIRAALAESLAARHDVTVIAPSMPGLPRRELIAGVRIVRAPVFFGGADPAHSVPARLVYIPMGVAAGKRLLETESFDIIHAHSLLPDGPVGDTLGRFANTPNVLCVGIGELVSAEDPAVPRSGLLQGWARRFAQRADCVVCPSEATASRLRDALGADISIHVAGPDESEPDEIAQRYEELFVRVVQRHMASGS